MFPCVLKEYELIYMSEFASPRFHCFKCEGERKVTDFVEVNLVGFNWNGNGDGLHAFILFIYFYRRDSILNRRTFSKTKKN